MNDDDEALPDEVETRQALADAAAAVGGSLDAAGGRGELRLPGARLIIASATGAAEFPLSLSRARWRVALPACGDAVEMAEPLRAAVMRQEGCPAVDLAGQKVPGWEAAPAADGQVTLDRTSQATKWWPATARVTVASGAAAVEVRQALAAGSDAVWGAVDHLLAWASRGVVQVDRQPAPGEHTICYHLAMPAGLLTPARLAGALSLLGAHYRAIAPALDALAGNPALTEVYITLNRRSK